MLSYESDITFERSATSLYPKKIILANNYLENWASFYEQINKEVYVDRYHISKNIESYLIPAIADIAFALESMLSFWIHFIHPLYKIEISSIDSNGRVLDFDAKPFISNIVFAESKPSFRKKLEALLVCCFNNYISPLITYKKIGDIPAFCYPIHSCSINALTLHTTLSYLYDIRSNIVHSAPLYDYAHTLKNPLDHIIQIQNINYIDKLTNAEFVSRTDDALQSLNNTFECFNYLAEILVNFYTSYDIPSIRFYDPISANYRFASKKIQLRFDKLPNGKKFDEMLRKAISWSLQLNTKLTDLNFKPKLHPSYILNYGNADYLYMKNNEPLGKTIFYMRDTLPVRFKNKISLISHIYPLDALEKNHLEKFKTFPPMNSLK